jgi:hypothetical protein
MSLNHKYGDLFAKCLSLKGIMDMQNDEYALFPTIIIEKWKEDEIPIYIEVTINNDSNNNILHNSTEQDNNNNNNNKIIIDNKEQQQQEEQEQQQYNN